jgi:hypothetical protein
LAAKPAFQRVSDQPYVSQERHLKHLSRLELSPDHLISSNPEHPLPSETSPFSYGQLPSARKQVITLQKITEHPLLEQRLRHIEEQSIYSTEAQAVEDLARLVKLGDMDGVRLRFISMYKEREECLRIASSAPQPC